MNRREYIQQTAAYLGYAISASSFIGILDSCQKSENTSWKLDFFDEQQAITISQIAETICPKTDSPGAIELGIPQFIDKMTKHILSENDQKVIIEGIQALNKDCQDKFGKPFAACTSKDKEQILTELDKNSPKFPTSMWGITLVEKPEPITFFRRIKSLTLLGYFTSEKIAKNHLVYDPIPGKYVACMPLNGQNAWAE